MRARARARVMDRIGHRLELGGRRARPEGDRDRELGLVAQPVPPAVGDEEQVAGTEAAHVACVVRCVLGSNQVDASSLALREAL